MLYYEVGVLLCHYFEHGVGDMVNLNKHVVVLIDADNVPSESAEQVMKLAEYYGIVDACYAYGDWEVPPLAAWRAKMPPKVKLIQVERVGKEATDRYLLMDAGEFLGRDQSVDIFIIVSGDGGFASACQFIKDRDRYVIVVGNKEKMAGDLQNACDTFYYLENLDDELDRLAEEHHGILPNEVRAFWNILRSAFFKFYDHIDWLTLAELGNKLREVDLNYDSKFGQHKLSDWLSNFGGFLEIDGQMVRMNPIYFRYSLLVNAYRKTSGGFLFLFGRKSVTLAQLEQVLRELDPDYESHFGGKELSAWLKDYPDAFDVSEHSVTLLLNQLHFVIY